MGLVRGNNSIISTNIIPKSSTMQEAIGETGEGLHVENQRLCSIIIIITVTIVKVIKADYYFKLLSIIIIAMHITLDHRMISTKIT